ncbi:antibiotic biosynthesis monooxygenase [Candidatus Binatia bacterium]|nr:antibiotic biosynthesis monooxygenase [Candidatus Binatia bacterium]
MTIIAKLKVRAGQENAFEAAASEMVEYVKTSEPGTRTYILHKSTADSREYLFYEVYVDQAAAATHGGSEQMMKFLGAAQGLLEGHPEIGMYEELIGKK